MIRSQQPPPILETRLATLLLGELVRHEIDDTYVDIVLDDLEIDEPVESDYATFELVFAPIVMTETATTQFVRIRDTTHDHIETVKFPTIDADTVPPQVSTPYALVELEEERPAFRLAMTSAPFERVDIQDLRFARRDVTEVIYAAAPRARWVTVVVSIVVLAGALGLGLGIVLLAT